MKKLPLISSLCLFIILCISGSYWILQLMKPVARKIVAPPQPEAVATVDSVAGLFGGALAVASNYQLKGIIVANPVSQSGAILAVDGKPAQAYRLNSEISPGIALTEIHAGYILLLDHGNSKRVDLPQEASSMATAAPRNSPTGFVNPNPAETNPAEMNGSPGRQGVISRPPLPLPAMPVS